MIISGITCSLIWVPECRCHDYIRLLATYSRKHEVFWGAIFPKIGGSRRRLAGPYYAEFVCRDLHSRLLMERTQLKKKVDELRQEERKLHNDWTVLKYHLEDLKLIRNEQDEEISYLKIQQQQVGAGDKSG